MTRATTPAHEPDGSPTARFRHISPGWAWCRDNFTMASVLTIAGLVLTAGVGYLEQRADLKAIRGADPTKRLEKLENGVQQLLQQRAADRQQLQDLAAEVGAQRAQWLRVQEVAEAPPPPRRRRGPGSHP